MSKRSFEKIRDLPFRKDIKPGHGVGREFDELVKDNKNLSKLSSLGQKRWIDLKERIQWERR